MLASPRSHLVSGNIYSLCSKPFFDEQNLRIVIRMLSEHVSVSCPWRDNVKW